MVAEVLIGIALVSKSCEIISKTIGAAKDISSVANEIDNLFTGSKQLKVEEMQARKSGLSVTEIVINQQLAAEQVALCKEAVILRFGYFAWQDILKLQKEVQLEEKARAAAKRREAEEKKELAQDVATVGMSVAVGIAIIFVLALTILVMV